MTVWTLCRRSRTCKTKKENRREKRKQISPLFEKSCIGNTDSAVSGQTSSDSIHALTTSDVKENNKNKRYKNQSEYFVFESPLAD